MTSGFLYVLLASKGLNITALVGNALTADENVEGQFDHILLMGPLYHLLEESERIQAVYSALKLLKPQGIFFASFI
ncbi:MAG: class I SAM-dependent methyltransferase, partial [Clostridia bacterium]|nr:class I SAM-dependent methyltransferase [Clostridia bacterium]